MEHKPRVAVLGCGAWGQNWVRVLHELGALAMVCDPSPERQAVAHELAPGVRITASQYWAMTDPTIDAVVIATSAPSHYQIATQALDVGLDVLVEKPLTLCLREAIDLVERAMRYDRILMVGHIMLYHPAFRKMQCLIKRGDIGEVIFIRSSRLNTGVVRPDPETVLWSFGPHDISMVLAIMGKLPDKMTMGTGLSMPPVAMRVNCAFGSVETRHWFSWQHRCKCQTFEVTGDCGILGYDGVSNQISLYDGERGVSDIVPFPPDEPLMLEAMEFLRCIETRQEPVSSGARALDVIEVIEQAHRGL